MAIFVKYVGNDESELRTGKIYKVVFEDRGRYSSEYELEGILGYFNTCLFKKVPVYQAYSNEVPCEGKRCELTRIEEVDGRRTLVKRLTGKVRSIERKTDKSYTVVTGNSVYLVKLI